MLEQALKLVNDARAAIGQPPLSELPKAIAKHPCQCVISRSLPAHLEPHTGLVSLILGPQFKQEAEQIASAWKTDAARTTDYENKVKLPPVLQDFISLFDRGAYPELIERI